MRLAGEGLVPTATTLGRFPLRSQAAGKPGAASKFWAMVASTSNLSPRPRIWARRPGDRGDHNADQPPRGRTIEVFCRFRAARSVPSALGHVAILAKIATSFRSRPGGSALSPGRPGECFRPSSIPTPDLVAAARGPHELDREEEKSMGGKGCG
jgi:hypothetical protein